MTAIKRIVHLANKINLSEIYKKKMRTAAFKKIDIPSMLTILQNYEYRNYVFKVKRKHLLGK